MPIIFVFGIYFMKKYVFDLVDEVLDDGDALVVKNNGQEQRIALADITNVSYGAMTSPPRVVLSLRHATVFGDEIAFCAPVQIMTFSQSPLIADLIKRVERARNHITGARSTRTISRLPRSGGKRLSTKRIVAGNDVVAVLGQIFDDAERFERVHDVRRRKRILLGEIYASSARRRSPARRRRATCARARSASRRYGRRRDAR